MTDNDYGEAAAGADEPNGTVLERLAQRLQRVPAELGELVEEEHAVVCERHSRSLAIERRDTRT